jgi:hypothetical protein
VGTPTKWLTDSSDRALPSSSHFHDDKADCVTVPLIAYSRLPVLVNHHWVFIDRKILNVTRIRSKQVKLLYPNTAYQHIISCCILSFGWFHGVGILCADVSVHSVLSSWVFLFTLPMKMEHTECYETSRHRIQTPGYHPKERTQEFATLRKVEIKNRTSYKVFSTSATGRDGCSVWSRVMPQNGVSWKTAHVERDVKISASFFPEPPPPLPYLSFVASLIFES